MKMYIVAVILAALALGWQLSREGSAPPTGDRVAATALGAEVYTVYFSMDDQNHLGSLPSLFPDGPFTGATFPVIVPAVVRADSSHSSQVLTLAMECAGVEQRFRSLWNKLTGREKGAAVAVPPPGIDSVFANPLDFQSCVSTERLLLEIEDRERFLRDLGLVELPVARVSVDGVARFIPLDSLKALIGQGNHE